MEIKTGKDIHGRDYDYAQCGLVRGRNWLLANGFTKCPNPVFFQKGNRYARFNRLTQVWFFETEGELQAV